MMTRLALFGLIAVAAPATAADIATSHEQVSVPPGKLHAQAYRPLARSICTNPHRSHGAGKMHLGSPAAFQGTACERQEAAADKPKRG